MQNNNVVYHKTEYYEKNNNLQYVPGSCTFDGVMLPGRYRVL